jgi:hypothetical protein
MVVAQCDSIARQATVDKIHRQNALRSAAVSILGGDWQERVSFRPRAFLTTHLLRINRRPIAAPTRQL